MQDQANERTGRLVLDLSVVNHERAALSLPPIDLDVFAEGLSSRLVDLGLTVSKQGFANDGDGADLAPAPGAGDYVIVLRGSVRVDELVAPALDACDTGKV